MSVLKTTHAPRRVSWMWDSLSSQADAGTEVSRSQFTKVFLGWQGIDEQVELQELLPGVLHLLIVALGLKPVQ